MYKYKVTFGWIYYVQFDYLGKTEFTPAVYQGSFKQLLEGP